MKNGLRILMFINLFAVSFLGLAAQNLVKQRRQIARLPAFHLIPSEKFTFRSFVDCNMATAWIGDSFRIFPGKYGEDPLWGDSRELKYASGTSVDTVFLRDSSGFTQPNMPANSPPGTRGLHGAVWFESLYQDSADRGGQTLYALYHNENYPSTLPYDPTTGEGYKDERWPEGLKGPETKTAVCRIGIMKSMNGGRSWTDQGILIQDLQPRLILRPHNTGINFAGGNGDPSAVANGGWLYVFYGEYGYPGLYDELSYDSTKEWKGQCISIARIRLSDLNDPSGNARRWNGHSFSALPDSAGKPVTRLQIARDQGGGAASSPWSKYYWGPSVSWNEYLHCWVMLMAKAEGPSWQGNSIYISFNRHADLGPADNSQDWSKPALLLKKKGHTLWYPSLQPLNTQQDKKSKYSSLRLGQKSRLFYKDIIPGRGDYISEFMVDFGQ